MPTAKLNLKQGTSLTRGIADRQRDQARVRCFVTGLTNNASIRSQAIEAAKAALPSSFHHEIGDLPLAAATASPTGPDRAYVELIFARTRSAPPTRPAFDFASETTFDEQQQRERVIRLVKVDGSVEEIEPTLDEWFTLGEYTSQSDVHAAEIRSYNRVRPITQIAVPFVLDTHPHDVVQEVWNRVNTDAVKINGVERAPFSLLFRRVRLDPVDKPDELVYTGDYIFFYVETTWLQQRLRGPIFAELQSDGSFTSGDNNQTWWMVDEFLPRPMQTAAFAGKFPTHDGQGPEAA